MTKHLEGQSSTDALQQMNQALALLAKLVRNSHRKSAIKVRGGRARARTATRDERGRFVPKLAEPETDSE
jgi:hypothetical protein